MNKWVAVGTADDIVKRKKVVVEIDGRDILVLAHEGQFFAFDNICIHRQRELSKGVILNGKIVCPGHQWAFALDTGWEAVKQECQPTHEVQLVGDQVEVCVASASLATTDNNSVKQWIEEFGQEVAAVDIAAARLPICHRRVGLRYTRRRGRRSRQPRGRAMVTGLAGDRRLPFRHRRAPGIDIA